MLRVLTKCQWSWQGNEVESTDSQRCGRGGEKLGDRPHAFPFSPPLTQNRYDHNMYSPFKCWDISTTYKPRFEDIPFDKENMSRFFLKDPLWFQLVVFFSFGATHSFAALPQKEMVPCTINPEMFLLRLMSTNFWRTKALGSRRQRPTPASLWSKVSS